MGIPFTLDCGESFALSEKLRAHGFGTVKCTRCGLTNGVLINLEFKPLYALGDFIDLNRIDGDFQRLESHIAQLKGEIESEEARDELMLCYLIIRELCRAKIAAISENEVPINLNELNKWKIIEEGYYRQYEAIFLERYRRGRGGNFYPYPYVFKPPEPPGDIGISTNVQLNQPVTEEELDIELFCMYCGSKLAMDERFCSVCGKKS